MLYRVLKPIYLRGATLPPDSLISLNLSPAQEEALVRLRKALSPAAPPPLEILPGWSVRSQRLAKAGYGDTMTFLEGDADVIAKAVKASPALVRRWQDEVKRKLVADPKGGD